MEALKLSCRLTTPELQERKRTVIAELKSLVREKIETPTGFKYRFEGSDRLIDLLTDFIKTERLCCPFFVFTLTVSGDEGTLWLDLSGPVGVKALISEEIEF